MASPPDPPDRFIIQELERIIGLYGFSDQAVVTPLSESENKVFLLTDPEEAETYVIRVNSGRLSYHTPQSIASELMWLAALRHDTDITVPKVRITKDGSFVQTIAVPGSVPQRHAAIYSFLPGTEPPEDNLISGFERLGEISARMHAHVRNWAPPPRFERHAWTPEAILDNRYNWGNWRDGWGVDGEVLKLLSRLDKVLRDQLVEFPTDHEHFGLIHADLRLANLLVEGDRTAIIDFDDCGYGWYLFDLAAALSFLEERPDVPKLIESWLKGYRKVAPVPSDMKDRIPTLIMLRRLQLMGWVGYQRQHLDFAREIAPAFTADTCRLAEEYLSRSRD